MELKEMIAEDARIFAHSKEGSRKETLWEHTRLCEEYFDRITEQRRAEEVLCKFYRKYTEAGTRAGEGLFLESVRAVITCHDAGKINPRFQREIMKNDEAKGAYSCLNGTNHSFLSAVLYLDYFWDRIAQETLEKKEKDELKVLVYIHSYLISRHHSDLESLGDYSVHLQEGGEGDRILQFLEKEEQNIYKGPFYFKGKSTALTAKVWKRVSMQKNRSQRVWLFIYSRLVYSLLVASDYYATTGYMSETMIWSFGNECQSEAFAEAFEKSKYIKNIRDYEAERYGKGEYRTINDLRNELFLETEQTYRENARKELFFLEAPTGSGKSNTAMNLSFQMLKNGCQKLFYVYPFNTLVEQNRATLEEIFSGQEEVREKIAVINSVSPIPVREKHKDETWESESCYESALLDRQFLNDEFILTTHVSFFRTLFGNRREDLFGVHQLLHSVVVLDEIQSYKNTLWSEIIIFLQEFAKLFGMKVIIMSATLPNLTVLTGEKSDMVPLVTGREKYFSHPLFRDRVVCRYELLGRKMEIEELGNHILAQAESGRKILIEMQTKTSAEKLYRWLVENGQDKEAMLLMTGDDNQAARAEVIRQIREREGTVILTATQVVEAGVDIDMDIGYKAISKLDSEEQFLGRINRSSKKERKGTVYFFQMDTPRKIYGQDVRINRELTLQEEAMREILSNKDFQVYYAPVLAAIQKQINERRSETNLEDFFEQTVGTLNFVGVRKRMELIEENQHTISVFLARNLPLPNGQTLDGKKCWDKYRELLENKKMGYARKMIELSKVRSDISNFIYEMPKGVELPYLDKIGDLLYVEDGEQYFENGKLNREKILGEGGMFL